MDRNDSAFDAEFAALKRAFRQRLSKDLAVFAAAPPQPQPAELQLLAERAHRLAGAAGSFGEAQLSEAARRFERSAATGTAGEAVSALRDLLSELERALAA